MDGFQGNINELRARARIENVPLESISLPPIFDRVTPARIPNVSDMFKKLSEDPETQVPTIKNAAILLLNDNNEVMLVQVTKSGNWTLPGGRIDPYETPWVAALREFMEETTFVLDTTAIQFKKYFDYGRSPHTRIYVIGTSQTFGAYDPSKVDREETCALKYVPVRKLLNGDYAAELRRCNTESIRALRNKIKN